MPDLDVSGLKMPHHEWEILLFLPVRLKRTGMEMRLLVEGASGATRAPRADRSLQRLIARARRFHDLVMTGNGMPIQDLAAEAGVSPSYFTRVLRLSFLAPDITRAIIQGHQPAAFSATQLMAAGRFAQPWSEQRRQFGFE